MHYSNVGSQRLLPDLRKLDSNAGHTPPDAWVAVELSEVLLALNHRNCPLTDHEVAVMLLGLDGQYVVWTTRQPTCLLDALAGSGIMGVGYVDRSAWDIEAPVDLSALT